MASSTTNGNGKGKGSSSSSSSSAPRAVPVPGSYGLPVIGNLSDRLDFYYRQGQDKYFQSRVERYGSTVVRINVPRGPFLAINPRVVALLDAKSFTVLFDLDKVDKTDVLVGFVVSPSLTGGYRICSYLDPSEPSHATLKQLLFSLLLSRKDAFIPVFHSNYSSLLATVDSQLQLAANTNAKAAVDFNKLHDVTLFDFLGEAYFGERPAPGLSSKATKWLLVQLCSLFTLGLPAFVEEPLLHSVRLPAFLVHGAYKDLFSYYSSAGSKALDTAETLGLSRDEACHNLLYMMILNSYAAFKLLLPGILASVGTAADKEQLHKKLSLEIRAAVAEAGGEVTLAALEKMELTKSVVWEALRFDPPVKYQYGRAKADLQVESHDAVYAVNKGDLMVGFQPCATRDARVFGPTAGQFVADRFVGDEGRELLKYVYWSNGRETEEPTVGNKQCPGKDTVVLVGRLFVVELFLAYDTFTLDVTKGPGGTKVAFTSVTKATTTAV